MAHAPSPEVLSRELRQGDGADLRRRRWMVGLSTLGAAMGQIVSLYQVGVIRRLPDLPIRPFDATRVDAAPYAYSNLAMPDGPLMVGTYAVTAALAAAGGRDRNRDQPLLPVLLAAKAAYDAVTTVRLARQEWSDTRALCGYCQTATLASMAILALSLPGAVEGARHLAAGRPPL